MRRPAAGTVAALTAVLASGWLLHRDGTWDTYRAPLFWPFVFTAGIVTVFSTSELGADARVWRTLIARVAVVAALVVAIGARLAAANPINDIHALDVAVLAMLAAALAAAGGVAAAVAQRSGATGWMATAWCVSACLLAMWLIPRAALWLRP